MFRKQPDALRKFFYPALILKLTAGLLLGWYYLNVDYEGDTFIYFKDAKTIVDLASRNPHQYLELMWMADPPQGTIDLMALQPRAFFFSKVTSVLLLFSGGSYVMLSLIFSFISFCGAWYVMKILTSVFEIREASVFAFLFFPSVVFWSSGVIKESAAMAALFFLAGVFLKIHSRQRIRVNEWILILLSLWILWNLKYYFIAVFLPITCTLLVMKLLVARYVRIQNQFVYSVVSTFVFVVPIVIVSLVHPNFYPERFLQVIVENYDAFIAHSEPDNVIHFDNIDPTPVGILPHIPKAVFSGIFRPLIWEVTTAAQLAAALENVLIFILMIGAAISFWRNRKSYPIQGKELVVWTVVYILILDAFLTLSSPNFGTLSRYRVGFLPFLILLISIPLPWKKFKPFA
jgi:hypothetical protein